MSSKPIVVIGGGISGLSATYFLHSFGKSILKDKRIILVEASKRFGGWIQSVRHEDGVVYEIGPRSFRVAGKAGLHALALVENLGLSDEVIGVPSFAPAAKKRLIYVNNRLHQLPNTLFDLFRTKEPFTKKLGVYLANEMKTPKLPLNDDDDISVFEFVEKRFGIEFAKYFADPICRGISAGDAKQLSMKSMFPNFYEAERKHGSVVRGMLKPAERDLDEIKTLMTSKLITKARKNKWNMWTFRLGTQSLTDQLTEHLSKAESDINIYNDSKVEKIQFNEDGSANISIRTPNESVDIDASHIFSTIPAHSLAKCIQGDQLKKLRESLESIKNIHTVVVNLEYNGRNRIEDAAFGFLTPSTESLPVLGIVYDSCTFPELDGGNDITKVSVMMGGSQFDEIFGSVDKVDKDKCFWMAVESVKKCLRIDENPSRFYVSINKSCIPQYNIGHSKLLSVINTEINENNLNLKLLGASYRGISVNECILNSKQCISKFLSDHENMV